MLLFSRAAARCEALRRLATTHSQRSCSRTMATAARPGALQGRVVRGIVFDMDGTLTKPTIDFADMRRRVGVPAGMDILDYIASLPTDLDKQRAFGVIAEIEEKALEEMQLMPGVLELCRLLDARGLPRALVTRNVSASVEFFHRTHFSLPPFVPALSREFTPYKPHPASLLQIANHWGIAASELVMIGDSAKDDIVCGRRAGSVTVLLDTAGRYAHPEELEGEEQPDFHVTTLYQIGQLLQDVLDPQPPPRPPTLLSESMDDDLRQG